MSSLCQVRVLMMVFDQMANGELSRARALQRPPCTRSSAACARS